MHLGDPAAAIPLIEKGIRLSPQDAGIPGAYQVLGQLRPLDDPIR